MCRMRSSYCWGCLATPSRLLKQASANPSLVDGMVGKRFFLVIGVVMLLALAACQMIAPSLLPTSAVVEPQSAESTPPPALLTQTPLDNAIPEDANTPAGPITLRLWLPQQFDPGGSTPAGDLLNARLSEFMDENPGVRIEVRLKALEGSGGLLESLAAANAAAPLALPDLIALPRPLLESAALKGLVHPYDGMTGVLEADGWYDYARQLAYLQESIFGLPFAGDALVLVYHPLDMDIPPRDWETAMSIGSALAFSAADSQALFTINQYQAAGGTVWDAQGHPYLDESVLTQVLTFYQQASQSGLMPLWLTQLESDEQVWQAFLEEQAPMAVVWASHYFTEAPGLSFKTMIAPPITADGQINTMATGWIWALAAPDRARRMLAAQLAEFLVEPQFLAEWNYAARYLPPNTQALTGWEDPLQRTLIGRILEAAQLSPSEDLLSSLGPALEQAVLFVLKQQADPTTAAQIAVKQVNQP